MLGNSAGSGSAGLGWGLGGIHNSMHARFLEDAVPVVRQVLLVVVGRLSTAVPQAMHVIPGNDLRKPPGLDVADFDKPSIKQEDVGSVEGDPFGGSCKRED